MKTSRATILFCSLLCASLLLALTIPVAFAQQPSARIPSQASAENTQLLQFTAGGHILGFSSSGIYAATSNHALHVDFVGANRVQPQAETSANPSTAPRTDAAPPFSQVQYSNLWPGISLTYDAISGGILRSTYQLEVGADVRAIQLRYNAPLTVKADGNLSIAFEMGALNESAPLAWQVINGTQVPVAVSFTQRNNAIGFALGQYDTRYPLTIDPNLTWNTFLGGSGDDSGKAIAVDSSGNVYIAGTDSGNAFAAKLDSDGGLQWNTFLGSSGAGSAIALDDSGNVYVAGNISGNAFVAKLNSSDGGVVWNNTTIGGSGVDVGKAIAVDGSGIYISIYISGSSNATWGSPVNAYAGGYDAFVAKLDSDGGLQWNTFLGSDDGNDQGKTIALDGSHNVYVAGQSDATWDYSAVRAYTGGFDVFAAKLNSSGVLQWNTFLGGSGYDGGDNNGNTIAVDGSNNVYVSGVSYATWGSPLRAFSGIDDAFVAKLNSSGVLQWNTFLGSSGYDEGRAIALDGSSNIYVTGDSTNTWGSPLRAYTGNEDAFVAKLNSYGTLLWNTFLGSEGADYGNAITVDGSNSVYVAGDSKGAWGCLVDCTVGDYYTEYPDPTSDAFVAKLHPPSPNANLSNLVFSTGALTPAFATSTMTYTQTVDNSVASLTVTPTAQDATATITVNGITVQSGSASGPIALPVVSNTITTVVTAQDGTTKTYTVTVTRSHCSDPEDPACIPAIDVSIGGDHMETYFVPSGGSTMQSYAGVNSGPVQVVNTGVASKIVASERIAYSPDGGTTFTNFSELMGMPNGQLTDTYWFPFYNSLQLTTFLSVSNVGNADTWVTITIGGVPADYYKLTPNESKKKTYPNLNTGPVKVQSSDGVPIITSERISYNNNGVFTSFSELMGMPDGQLTDTYWFPFYNSLQLTTFLSVSNVGDADTWVTITIGGVPTDYYKLTPNESKKIKYPNLNTGPVKVQSSDGVPIITSERISYNNNGVFTSFSELMGMPDGQLTDAYLFPWYDSTQISTFLSVSNVGNADTWVTITIGGDQVDYYKLTPNTSKKIKYSGLNTGPLKVQSTDGVKIITSSRVSYLSNGVFTSFSEMLGMPEYLLEDICWFPFYNSLQLNTKISFGVP